MASEFGSLNEKSTTFKERLYVYLIPFYAGVLFTCVLGYPKKDKSFVFSLIMILGAFSLLLERKIEMSYSIGTALIGFAGGYFDGITPTYCKLLKNNRSI